MLRVTACVRVRTYGHRCSNSLQPPTELVLLRLRLHKSHWRSPAFFASAPSLPSFATQASPLGETREPKLGRRRRCLQLLGHEQDCIKIVQKTKYPLTRVRSKTVDELQGGDLLDIYFHSSAVQPTTSSAYQLRIFSRLQHPRSSASPE